MPGLVLTPVQVATLLDAADLEPGVGSPLHGLTRTHRLPGDHPDRQSLLDQSALVATPDGVRANAAVASALRACARPDEVVWFGADAADASITVCRRGRLFVDCSRRSDQRVSLVFPLDRAQVVLFAIAALSGDRPEPAPSGFALRAPLGDVVLLRAIGDVHAARGGDVVCGRDDVVAALVRALDEPIQVVALDGYGRRADVGSLVDDPSCFDDAIARLAAAGHLVPGEYRVSPTSAAVLDAPVEAAFGVARRVIDDDSAGGRRLRERHLRVERRGERLVTARIVSVDGAPQLEFVERTRAEVRSLVGVFLLGDLWDQILAEPAATA